MNNLFGNGKDTTDENGDDWGIVYCCFTHINYIELDGATRWCPYRWLHSCLNTFTMVCGRYIVIGV